MQLTFNLTCRSADKMHAVVKKRNENSEGTISSEGSAFLNERHNLFREDKNKLELARPTISY